MQTNVSDNIDAVLAEIAQRAKKHFVSTEEMQRNEKRLQAEKERQIRRLSKLPYLFFNHSLCNKRLLEFVEENYQQSLYLVTKESGKCKTRTMNHIAEKYYIKNQKYVYFYSAGDLTRAIADAYGEHGKNSFIKELKNIDLLVIDDLGKEKLTERAIADIYEVVDCRYLSKKPTWISTNYLGRQISEKFGEKGPYLIRRIKETYKIYSE